MWMCGPRNSSSADAKAVGIELKLQTLDENTLGSLVYSADAPDFDLYVWGWDSGTPDPDYMLGIPLTSQIGNNNDTYYSNPKYDALYDQQATTVDIPTRTGPGQADAADLLRRRGVHHHVVPEQAAGQSIQHLAGLDRVPRRDGFQLHASQLLERHARGIGPMLGPTRLSAQLMSARYLFRKILSLVATLFAVVTFNFLLFHVLPGIRYD